jgi:hypothetical protein
MKSHIPSSGCGNYGSPSMTRREMLRRSAAGFGALALTSLLGEEGRLFASEGHQQFPLKPNGRAKSVILLHMGGGPSHVDTWDPKPSLAKFQGRDVPESIASKVPMNKRLRLKNIYPCPFEFKQYGQSGIAASELFQETARHVDDICVIRSMQHDSPIHTPAEYLALSGSLTGTRPTIGAWLYYGFGSENQNLPGFIVMDAGENFSGPAIWSAGFLPARYQGTLVKAAEGIPNIKMPAGFTEASRRAQLDFIGKMNQRHLERHGGGSELEARILSYEMAFRMQTSAPEVFDLKGESDESKKLYGIDNKDTAEYGTNCLLARRLIERGVRFVQLNQGGWDAHGDLKGNHEKQARLVDRPIAGLLADLKNRGLLNHTLVIWGGEFGRTPTAEGGGKNPGRDHSPTGYSMWLAGGGVKGGQIIGATDEVGYTVVDRPIHPNDFHATILHALGIDQQQLYYEHQNRKELVTFNGGEVIKEVFG